MHRDRTPASRRARRACALAIVVVASGLASVTAASPTASAWVAESPKVTGEPCAPGVGVTVVVDFQELGGVRMGCAPGAQADGFAAIAAAGITYNEDPGAPNGLICQIEHVPAAGNPSCLDDGFWSYSKSDGT